MERKKENKEQKTYLNEENEVLCFHFEWLVSEDLS
jgi:hypothetical protein